MDGRTSFHRHRPSRRRIFSRSDEDATDTVAHEAPSDGLTTLTIRAPSDSSAFRILKAGMRWGRFAICRHRQQSAHGSSEVCKRRRARDAPRRSKLDYP